ncbi:hypothetical protein KIPB_002782 [Kipferlia bialata]|uniref:Splicing factor Cactin C-terminal domain-containing protein n=1 Tax=Kipferlia bialata TaxID=797122 RepID=A0A9K3CUD9_9EUKA|nr:hypothetical protein KIPB_002782 [Kipferlia bialata]|eukprot:g2782.t1
MQRRQGRGRGQSQAQHDGFEAEISSQMQGEPLDVFARLGAGIRHRTAAGVGHKLCEAIASVDLERALAELCLVPLDLTGLEGEGGLEGFLRSMDAEGVKDVADSIEPILACARDTGSGRGAVGGVPGLPPLQSAYWTAVAVYTSSVGAAGSAEGLHPAVAQAMTNALAKQSLTDMRETLSKIRRGAITFSDPGYDSVVGDHVACAAAKLALSKWVARAIQHDSVMQGGIPELTGPAQTAVDRCLVPPMNLEDAPENKCSAALKAGRAMLASYQDHVTLAEEEELIEIRAEEEGVVVGADGSERVRPVHIARVIMGVDWNQYNKAHYTKENPPPKVVRGYRFAVFLPNLDREAMGRRTPSWSILERGDDSENTHLLCFKTGPPYAPIVFEIVRKQWVKGARSGFRSEWRDNTLFLDFNLRYISYKR